jgi:hypothetical protein
MGTYVNSSVLNQSCKPYPELFSCHENGEAMKLHAFPLVKRGTAEKCEGVAAWLQKGSRCSFVNYGELREIVENRGNLSKEQVDYYATAEGTLDLNKKGISLALDKRVALFFQQAILCYGMSDFIFSARGADAQIGTSPAMKLESVGASKNLKREAAHSSTIPTLIAHAKDGSTPDGFVYLKGGGSYHDHNATIGMDEGVNGADELIDGKGNDNKLRETTVKILNLVAEGLDPVKATKLFCEAFEAEVRQTAAGLAPQDKRRLVLDLYDRKIGKIQRSALHNPLFFDRLLGVIVSPTHAFEKDLRQVVYQKRYDVIRLQEVVESRIAKRMDGMKETMKTNDRSFLEHMLLKEFSEPRERRIIEKLLGKTATFFETEGPVTQLKTFRTRVDNLREKYKEPLAILMRNMRADFRELSCAEFTYRAGVFRDLRTKVNRWTQMKFRSEYLKTTGTLVSQAWVSRMEQLSRVTTKATYSTPINQRRRYVTLVEGQRCAETFGVDPGIFLPCLFTSF